MAYIYSKSHRIRYVLAKETQRKIRFHQVDPLHDDLVHDAEVPYLYIDKDFWRELGKPEALEMTVRGMFSEGDNEV